MKTLKRIVTGCLFLSFPFFLSGENAFDLNSVFSASMQKDLLQTNKGVSFNDALNPTIINGDVMMCPEETDTLFTQEFDTYQWYKGGTPIPGANDQSLVIDYYHYVGNNI